MYAFRQNSRTSAVLCLRMVAVCVLALSGLTGCTPGATTGSTATLLALPSFGTTVPGKPVDVYVRLARLAKSCWFTPPAPLGRGYVFTADVSPEAQGGAGSILIFQRDAALAALPPAAGERGQKAFAVSLTPAGEGTAIGVENAKIPEPFAGRMRADVERWAAGETSCGEAMPWPTQAALGDAVPEQPKGAAHKVKAAKKQLAVGQSP